MDILGLQQLEPKLAATLKAAIDQLETETQATMKVALSQVNDIANSALDRINGMQVVAVFTIKLPESGAKMAEIPK